VLLHAGAFRASPAQEDRADPAPLAPGADRAQGTDHDAHARRQRKPGLMAIPFIKAFEPRYGELVTVTPRIARVVANNPGPFTFTGSGVYIVGDRDVAVIDPGPDMPEHIEALKRALAGKRLTHILVTHTHIDHSPAAKPLKEWSGAKTYAFGPHGSGKD